MRRFLTAIAMLALPLSAIGVEPGAAAPMLSASDLGQPERRISLQELKGKVVYVDFWASWCVPCRLSMPALDALYREHGGKGFAVIGVNKDMSNDEALRFMKRVPVAFPLVGDPGDGIARAFEVKAMPSGYLIDRRGIVRKVHRGFTTQTVSELAKEIEVLLKEPA